MPDGYEQARDGALGARYIKSIERQLVPPRIFRRGILDELKRKEIILKNAIIVEEAAKKAWYLEWTTLIKERDDLIAAPIKGFSEVELKARKEEIEELWKETRWRTKVVKETVEDGKQWTAEIDEMKRQLTELQEEYIAKGGSVELESSQPREAEGSPQLHISRFDRMRNYAKTPQGRLILKTILFSIVVGAVLVGVFWKDLFGERSTSAAVAKQRADMEHNASSARVLLSARCREMNAGALKVEGIALEALFVLFRCQFKRGF